MRRTLVPLLAASAAVVVVGLVLSMLGYSPARAASVLVRGATGSPHAIAESILKAIPLLFTALAATLAFRAGVWNIGAEGQFVVGSIAAHAAIAAIPAAPAVALAAAALAGA
ncbi:MAG: ABC transporter permease subunit, partial [Thermoanaerobaculia bacterium]